jgi:hypothetical protein
MASEQEFVECALSYATRTGDHDGPNIGWYCEVSVEV